jgi:hypothetical protein
MPYRLPSACSNLGQTVSRRRLRESKLVSRPTVVHVLNIPVVGEAGKPKHSRFTRRWPERRPRQTGQNAVSNSPAPRSNDANLCATACAAKFAVESELR